jgi:3-methyladenine DNA glycosylase AlkD
MNQAKLIELELQKYSNKSRAEHSQRFFRTGKGEYGEGDVFIGVTVPNQRKVAKKYIDITFSELSKLLHSKTHEHRLTAIFILVYQYNKAKLADRQKIYKFYLQNTKYINNWDIIDSSAGYIVGEYLFELNDKSKTLDILTNLAKSSSIWERRIAIMSTFAFIMHGDHRPTFAIADILLHDEHDLIQKAVGWMLREVGKRVSQELEVEFLKSRYKTMPRTMLRYAIERFEETKRKKYLHSQI